MVFRSSLHTIFDRVVYFFAFDHRRSCWIKPCKTLVGATKIEVRRYSSLRRTTTTQSEKNIEKLSENDRKNDRKSTREGSEDTLDFRRENLRKSMQERLGRRMSRQMRSKTVSGALQGCF